MADTESIEKQVIKRQTLLKAIKDPFVDLWKTCTALGYPMRNDWEGTSQTGRDKEVEVYDNTCIEALNVRADGIYGYHVSPAIKWFTGRMGDKQLQDVDEVREWLQEGDEAMYYAYSRSNFYDASCIGNFLRDGDGIGLAVMFPEEIIGEGKISFVVPHPREIWIADDKYGKANLMHYKFKWTTLQVEEALEKNEIKKLSEALQLAIQKKDQTTTKWEFIWAIWPNPNHIKGSLAKGRRKYNTYLVQVDGTHLIRENGKDMFPPVWRVKKPSNLPYGRGLIGEALVSIGAANEICKTMLGAANWAVSGAWDIPRERKAEADLLPDGRNYYDDANREIRQIRNDIKYPFGAEERKMFQAAVKANFKVDFFMALTQAAMEGRTLTVPQVMEIQGEKAALMGSDLGTLNTTLDAIHDNVFDIEMKAGRLPEPPQIILDAMFEEQERLGRIEKAGRIEVDYIGPLAQAQKRLFQTEGIRHSIDSLAPLVDLQLAAQQPVTALDRLKVDETVEELFDAHGMPQKLMRSDDEVEEIQEARLRDQQMKEAAAMAAEAAKAAPGISKKVEDGSVLSEIAGAVE